MLAFNDNTAMPFGRYKGKKMANVPAPYLLWLFEKGCDHKGVKGYILSNLRILTHPTDSPMAVKIKRFMQDHKIVDIKMRMLRVSELLKIQGFPDGYRLDGNQTDQKKFIGNSVVPHVVKAWVKAMAALKKAS